jgi:hypothetical protein
MGWIGCYRLLVAGAAGIYLAFEGGPDSTRADEAGLGPYEEIVLRGARAVGELGGFGKIIALRSSTGSWRDAESSSSESDHAAGSDDVRVSAVGCEVLVRFAEDEVAGQTAVPDLGPFARVVVGTHEVRGDGQTLAVRVSRISPWQLTDRAGASFQGATREALVFLTGASKPRPAASPTPEATAPDKVVDQPAPTGEDPAPVVWVDRVRTAPTIYISRPDPKPR